MESFLLNTKTIDLLISFDNEQDNKKYNSCSKRLRALNWSYSAGMQKINLLKREGWLEMEQVGRDIRVELTKKGKILAKNLKEIRRLL